MQNKFLHWKNIIQNYKRQIGGNLIVKNWKNRILKDADAYAPDGYFNGYTGRNQDLKE